MTDPQTPTCAICGKPVAGIGTYLYRDGQVTHSECQPSLAAALRLPEVRALVDAAERMRAWTEGPGDRLGPILRQMDAALAAMKEPRPATCPDCRRPAGEPHLSWCPVQDVEGPLVKAKEGSRA